MPAMLMHLKILLPFHVFAESDRVSRIVAETSAGSFGLLPHRLDCVAPLVPGILCYETAGEGEAWLAVDEGVLLKAGREVLVSVRRAIAGSDLGRLREAVEREFLVLDDYERDLRSVMAKLESAFLRRYASFRHE